MEQLYEDAVDALDISRSYQETQEQREFLEEAENAFD